MIYSPSIGDEGARLEALQRYRLHSTPADQGLEELTSLAAEICNVPIAMISIVGEDQISFIAKTGLTETTLARDLSFCTHAVQQRQYLEICDATKDERFAALPAVTGKPHVRFYAGAPVLTSEGHAVGTLCVLDTVPRELSELQRHTLKVIARQIMSQLDLRRKALELSESQERFAKAFNASPGTVGITTFPEGIFLDVNDHFLQAFGYQKTEVLGRTALQLGLWVLSEERHEIIRLLECGETVRNIEAQMRTKSGGIKFILLSAERIQLGDQPCVLFLSHDMTERKAAEEYALWLASFPENNPNPIIEFDPASGGFTYTNSASLRLFPDLRERVLAHPYLKGLIDIIREMQAQGKTVERRELIIGKTLHAQTVCYQTKTGRVRIYGADITERKEMQEKLSEREEQLRLYAEHSPAAIAMLDRDMKYLVASRSWKESYRLDDKNIIGRSHYEIFPEIPARWKEIHQRCLAGAIEKCNEDAFVRADGSTNYLRWEIRPWHHANGSIGGLIMFTEDITERKMAEQKLRDSETLLRTVTDEVQVGLVLLDEQRRYLYANAAYTKVLGIPTENIVGRRVADVLPHAYSQISPRLDRAFAGERVTYELKLLTPGINPVERNFSATYEPRVQTSTGPQVLVMIIDITERKRAEEALTNSRRKLDGIINTVDGIVWEADARTFQFTFVSQRAERLLGYPLARWLEEPTFWRDHVHVEDRDRAVKYCIAATNEKKDHEFEYRMLAADGRVVWLRDLVSVIVENDCPVKLRGLMVDITDRKLAEAHVTRLNRVYAVLSDINQAIVREHDPRTMLTEACRIAVEKGGFRLAWIGMAKAGEKQVEITAHAGADTTTLEILGRLFKGDSALDCAFTRQALELGEPRVCNDVAGDLLAASWRDVALERNYRSMASLPLKMGSRMVGIFNLYASEAGFFDAEELRLLDELAIDVSFALEVHAGELQRRKSEQDLRASEERFRQLAENIDEVFWIANYPAKQILYVSPAYETIWGRTCASLMANPPSWLNAIHQEDRERVRQSALTKQAEGGYDEEYRVVRPDGSVRWVRDQAFPIKDAAGKVHRIVGMARNITERRQAEEALRDKQQFLEKAQQIGRIGSWVSSPDREGKLIWSTQTAQIFGFKPGEFDGRVETFFKMVHPEDHDAVLEASRATLAGERPYNLEHRIKRKDGQIRWVLEQADVERDAAGKPIRMMGVVQDITERKQLEAQLRQSQKMEAIGQLAGGVAHDFNNILAAMMMQVELAETAAGVPQGTLDMLNELRNSAERAASLTRQLLAFSRRQVMQSRVLDLNELVTSLTKMLQRILGEDVHLLLHPSPRSAMVRADAGMIDQVIMNLVVNARDAMPNGGRLLIETFEKSLTEAEASLLPDAKPGAHVCLRVSDTGSGITPENLARIFEPFFTTKEPGKGTGLGLATVFGIVRQHGGFINVSSELGKGTVFEILLPALDQSQLPVAAAEPKPKPRGGTETVLVVEDEPSVRMLTRIVLERHGYRVIEAGNGVEALRTWEAQKQPIHLLLTDIVMPEGIGGRELATRLREKQPGLRVIFTSGYSADFAGKDLHLLPGQNFIQKPSQPSELLETVRRCLDS